jgi:KUP system potassium uptake protein
MSITGSFMIAIFLHRRKFVYMGVAIMVTLIDITYFVSTLSKFTHGGYLSLVIAAIPFSIILIYTAGQRALYRAMKPMSHDHFLKKYCVPTKCKTFEGTQFFLHGQLDQVPAYIFEPLTNESSMKEVVISLDIKNDHMCLLHLDRLIAPGLSHLN